MGIFSAKHKKALTQDGHRDQNGVTDKQLDQGPARVTEPWTWDVPILFGIMLVLACAELGFTVDTFQYKARTHTWDSKTERNRIAFLLFSSVRTIALAAVYIGFHIAQKLFGNMHHTIFVVLSTIFWVVSGVLIHTLFGLIECGGVGSFGNLKINECHELKIIEWLAWALSIMAVISSIPVIARAWRRRKAQMERKKAEKMGSGRKGGEIA
ncbi:hypothetical protein EXIGLDRAFT_728946 [Exidia glandulosa HHB12029]|uniref:MARVEL domain-containing protein n=1 Tax=Exidia glandulosa HHB12029 TaxID=1314781 RepID=A0A165LNY9_EXIGL|nr:hypothetical protein EXIGLDRAFT_728946 [Exidia glandulosa HHB12029]